MKPLDFWDGGFESHSGHKCSFLVFVVQVAASATSSPRILNLKGGLGTIWPEGKHEIQNGAYQHELTGFCNAAVVFSVTYIR